MKYFLLWRICHRNYKKTILLHPVWLLRAGFLSVLIFLLCEGSVGHTPASQAVYDKDLPDRSCYERGKDQDEAAMGTLFMTIYDANGVKRLLSPEHPAVLGEGLYFTFPDDAWEYEICQNDGAWIKTAEQVYLDPRKEETAMICVRFRAKGSDGRLRYSRCFVLFKKEVISALSARRIIQSLFVDLRLVIQYNGEIKEIKEGRMSHEQ